MKRNDRISKMQKNLMQTVGIMTIATIIALMFRKFDFTESNIIMVFILGVLFVSRQTEGYYYGIVASVLGVLSFNFFFTEPLYTFVVHSREYPVTFGVMLIVALITSTLTTKVKREAQLSIIKEKRTETLYNISRNLLATRNIEQIISTAAVSIANLCNKNIVIYTIENNNLGEPFIYAVDNGNIKHLLSEKEREAANEAFKNSKVINSKVYYLPIIGRIKTFGVIGIDCYEKELSNDLKMIIDAIAVQISLSIEREILSKEQQESKMEMESERLRNNLLRAVSHDLKTPLTGIVGATGTVLDNWENIDDDTKKALLSGVCEDAQWLTHSVDNILDITRIEDGRIEVKKNMEAVEEIISEAVSRIQKYIGKHTLNIKIPKNLVMVSMDGSLIEQVLVNLIDNAIKHTKEDSIINITVSVEGENAVFEVSDNGKGINEKDLQYIFDRFYTTNSANANARKGIGLGLAICKSIILAHNSKITAYNGKNGGAVFRFTLPIGE